jgi:hypothetical protein
MKDNFKEWVEESMTHEEFIRLSLPLKQSIRRSYENMKLDIFNEVNNCTPESRYRTLNDVLLKWKIKRTGVP